MPPPNDQNVFRRAQHTEKNRNLAKYGQLHATTRRNLFVYVLFFSNFAVTFALDSSNNSARSLVITNNKPQSRVGHRSDTDQACSSSNRRAF